MWGGTQGPALPDFGGLMSHLTPGVVGTGAHTGESKHTHTHNVFPDTMGHSKAFCPTEPPPILPENFWLSACTTW